jgi:hypothetical protein
LRQAKECAEAGQNQATHRNTLLLKKEWAR